MVQILDLINQVPEGESGLSQISRLELLEQIARELPNLQVPFCLTNGSFAQPSIGAEVTITVDYTSWMQAGMMLQIGSVVLGTFQGGFYRVESVVNATSIIVRLISSSSSGIVVPDNSLVVVSGTALGDGISLIATGAVGDGVTDDTVAVQAAVDAAAISGVCVIVPSGYNFAISSSINIPPNVCIMGQGRFTYIGTAEEPAFHINNQSLPSGASTSTATIELEVYRQSISTWLNEANIGVKTVNSKDSNITIRAVEGFTIGVQCMGDTGGWQHNIVTLGSIRLNKIGVELNTIDNPTVGWCNENLFLGGNFGSGNTNQTLGRYGVRITSTVAYYSNNNVFVKPSFQMGPTPLGAVDSIGCDVVYGGVNTTISARFEGTEHACRFANGSSGNDFEFFGQADGSDYRDKYIDNSVNGSPGPIKYPNMVNFGQTDQQQKPISSWRSGLLHERAAMNSSGEVFCPGVFFWDTTQAAPVNKTIPSRVMINTVDGCLEGFKQTVGGQATHIGVRVDTSVIKEFIIGRECLGADGLTTWATPDGLGSGRLVLKPMDASLVVLDEPTFPQALMGSADSYSNTGAMANRWFEGVDHDIPFTPGDPIVVANSWIKVHEDVKFLDIMISSGTKPMKLRSFSISTRNFSMPAVDSLVWRDKSLTSKVACDETPISRYFEEGTVITNLDLASNPEVGWMLTAGNYATNGAWVASTVVRGEWRTNAGNVYHAQDAGASTVAPVHVSGTVAGADLIRWTFIAALGTTATWTLFGPNFISAFMKTVLDDANAAAAQTTLGVLIGTDVQAWDSFLDTIAAGSQGAAVADPAATLPVNGGITGLTISAAYSQAEVILLRDACETLRDSVEEHRDQLAAHLASTRTSAVIAT